MRSEGKSVPPPGPQAVRGRAVGAEISPGGAGRRDLPGDGRPRGARPAMGPAGLKAGAPGAPGHMKESVTSTAVYLPRFPLILKHTLCCQGYRALTAVPSRGSETGRQRRRCSPSSLLVGLEPRSSPPDSQLSCAPPPHLQLDVAQGSGALGPGGRLGSPPEGTDAPPGLTVSERDGPPGLLFSGLPGAGDPPHPPPPKGIYGKS